jgi:hypothetical protein
MRGASACCFSSNSFHKSLSLGDPTVLFGGLGGLILCVALFSLLWKHAHLASSGLVWLLSTLAPVLNPHWLGFIVLGERYLYLPSVGICWVVDWGLQKNEDAPGSDRRVTSANGKRQCTLGQCLIGARRRLPNYWRTSEWPMGPPTLELAMHSFPLRGSRQGSLRSAGRRDADEHFEAPL